VAAEDVLAGFVAGLLAQTGASERSQAKASATAVWQHRRCRRTRFKPSVPAWTIEELASNWAVFSRATNGAG